jgi:hypothetical protein
MTIVSANGDKTTDFWGRQMITFTADRTIGPADDRFWGPQMITATADGPKRIRGRK